MERATDKLTYKGSISEAIDEAKAQKKVFAVYISSQNESWLKWEQELFDERYVVEFITKYCVFLHLMPDSLGASQFAAIYPPKSIPSITLVGYTGVLLWHEVGYMGVGEGYLDARDLVNNIYRSWTSLHSQETSEIVSSHGPECQSSSSHNVAPLEKGSSSGSDEPLDSQVKPTEHSEQLAEPKKSEDHGVCEMEDENDTKQGKEKCIQGDMIQDREEQSNTISGTGKQVLESIRRVLSEESHVETSETAEGMAEPKKLVDLSVCEREDEQNDTKQGIKKCTQWDIKHDTGEQSTTTTDTANHLRESLSRNVNDAVIGDDADLSLGSQKNIPSIESHAKTLGTAKGMSTCSLESSQIAANQVPETTDAKRDADQVKTSNAMISNVIHFKIRMPNGDMLQASYTISDTLGSVKKYIDEHQTSGTGSYDLAIAYPRKVFSEKEIAMPLSELDFATRQSLIVVPRNRATGHPRGLSLDGTIGGNDGNNSGGYFQNVKRILSYMNPFSYLGGNATSSISEAAAINSRQDERKPAVQNQLPGQNRRTGGSANNPSGSGSRPFGSNVHTLRENEDEGPTGDRNMFWNGNSTQYGGNDDK